MKQDKKLEKINETKSWFFEMIKLINPEKKREDPKESNQKCKRKSHKWDHRNTRIIRDYYEKLNNNKMDNWEEMDKFPEMYNLPRLNQKEIENMNRPITGNEIESIIILKLPTNKIPGPDGFTCEFYERIRWEITPILSKNIAEEGTLLN